MTAHGLPESERFWAKVDKSEGEAGCWNWTAAKKEGGYGLFSRGYGPLSNRRLVSVHRYSWEYYFGDIAEDLVVDHLCHNASCVNPMHLRLVTRQQNNEHRKGANVTNRSSGVLGVHGSPNGNWIASVNHGGKAHYAGTNHKTIAEAEEAVVKLRLQLFTHNDHDFHRQEEVFLAAQAVRRDIVWSEIDRVKASIA